MKKQKDATPSYYLTGLKLLMFLVVAIATISINYAIIFFTADKAQQWAFISIEIGVLFGIVGGLAKISKCKDGDNRKRSIRIANIT